MTEVTDIKDNSTNQSLAEQIADSQHPSVIAMKDFWRRYAEYMCNPLREALTKALKEKGSTH